MKFKSLNGYINDDSSFISITIEDGENHNSIGDQMWINKEGTEMEITEDANKDVFIETMNLFDGSHKKSFKGAMMRMNVYF